MPYYTPKVNGMRTSHKRVGLSCRAVQLLSDCLDIHCCPECHTAKRRPDVGEHHLQWVGTPNNPKEFDPGLAYVCCNFASIASRAQNRGWDHAKTSAAAALKKKSPEKTVTQDLMASPTGPGMQFPKVYEVVLTQPTKTFDAVTLHGLGTKHAPGFPIHVAGGTHDWLECANPQCALCATNPGLYWSWKLQCWLTISMYALLDNALHLSNTHASIHDHKCASNTQNVHGLIVVPEYVAHQCIKTNGTPFWGAQYACNPRHVATIQWSVHDDYDGFRYIVHAKNQVPNDLQYLVWQYYDHEEKV